MYCRWRSSGICVCLFQVRTCISNVILIQYWFISSLSWKRVIANMEATEPRVPSSGVEVVTPCFCGVRFARSLVFCVVFCRSYLSFFLLVIALRVFFDLRLLSYPFSIFTLSYVVVFHMFNELRWEAIVSLIIASA